MFFLKVFVACSLLLAVVDMGSAQKTKRKESETSEDKAQHTGAAQLKSLESKSKGREYKTLQSTVIPRGYIDGRRCDRQCDGTRRSCFFSFDLETFYTMSKACYNCPSVLADCYRPDCIVGGGIRRTVMVVNRQMPGPAITVCEGDEIMVYLQNNLIDGEGTTIHWHGQHMVRDKYMDGVPWVTQCPIHFNNNFTYELWVDDPGTYWWHSHVEMQRGDGVYGPMIVRQTPERDIHWDLYDFDLAEHVVMITDWNDRLRLDVFEGYALAGDWLEPTGILINGYGYQSSSNITNTPTANFTVRRGFRYRFRLINAGFFDCPIEISIDNHMMRIISLDSHDVEPFDVNSFVSSSGERFDFIITANQPIRSYHIRAKGYLTCERLNTFTVGKLIYQGGENSGPGPLPTYATAGAPPNSIIFNPVSVRNATGYSQAWAIHQARAMEPIEPILTTNNVYKYYISVDMSALDHPVYHRYPYYGFYQVDPNLRVRTPQFNRISHKNLDVPLLPARYYINEAVFCNANTMGNRDCMNTFCECPHVISVPTGAVVEFVFVELFDQDEAPALHPIHLHGYSFRVMGWGELRRNMTLRYVVNLDNTGSGLPRNYDDPPLKDTVTVPKGGYTIVRFLADNPGFWFMHCHIDVHSSEGMDIVVKVGDNNEMPPVPDYFPECGNWPRY